MGSIWLVGQYSDALHRLDLLLPDRTSQLRLHRDIFRTISKSHFPIQQISRDAIIVPTPTISRAAYFWTVTRPPYGRDGQVPSIRQEHKVCAYASPSLGSEAHHGCGYGREGRSMIAMAVVELRQYQAWLTDRSNSSAFNTTVTPFAQRSQQYLKESFGQIDEKVCCSTWQCRVEC